MLIAGGKLIASLLAGFVAFVIFASACGGDLYHQFILAFGSPAAQKEEGERIYRSRLHILTDEIKDDPDRQGIRRALLRGAP